MNYSQFVYLILCLLSAYALLSILTNDTLVNIITGNTEIELDQPGATEKASSSGNERVILI